MTISRLGAVLAVAALVCLPGCKKGGSSSNSPTGPSNSTKLQGGWVGTITRPNGGGTILLNWNAGVTNSSQGDSLNGTITLTAPNGSTTAQAVGTTAGNDSQGYSIHLDFRETTPAANCKVLGNTLAAAGGDPFPAPYTTITVPQFSLNWGTAACASLVTFPGQQNFLTETVQLVLTKQ